MQFIAFASRTAVNPQALFEQNVLTRTQGYFSLQDTVHLTPGIHFKGNYQDPVEEFSKTVDELNTTSLAFKAALQQYKRNCKKGNTVQRKAELLDKIINTLDGDPTDAEEIKVAASIWRTATAAVKDDIFPYATVLMRNVIEMGELIEKHGQLLEKLDQQFAQLVSEGLLDKKEQAKYQKTRRNLELIR